MKSSYVAVVFSLVLPIALSAQEYRGTISGAVTDGTGASVASAKITVTETKTGTRVDTASDEAGKYNAPFLLPGDYDISVRAAGFKEFVRKGVHVGSGDHPTIDAHLEVGDATQSVEVTADAPLLNTENATAGQSITTREVEDLPLNGGTPMAFASLSLGVIGVGQPGLIHPFDSGGAAGWSMAGGYAQTSEIQVDGSPNATWDGRLAYSLPKDAVQEVKVKIFDSDASFGRTGGGVVSQVMRTGTNGLRGSLWEQNQPNSLTANDFFNNAKGVPRPVTHYNQYGATAGGPVVIPKVFNGRNKLFWFFAFEKLPDAQPNPLFLTVPTDAEKTGDFSKLLATDGASTQLYDPYSAVLSGTTVTRTPYPNNVIPKTELNPVSLAYLKFFSEPNITPSRPDDYQNFANQTNTTDDYNNELGRLDYNLNERSRMSFNIRRTGYSQIKNDYFNNESEGSVLFRNNWGATLDEVYSVNSSNVIDVRFNFTRMAESHANPSTGFDPTKLGFPSYMTANSLYLEMPVITFNSNSNFQNLSSSGNNNLPSQSFQIFGNWVTIKGNHTLKFGGDARQYRLNTFTVGNSTGTFSFSGNSWVRPNSGSSSTVVIGQDFASFLLGMPYSGSYDLNTFGSWYSYYAAPYAQDDWRVKPNLTINLGVRYDWNGPYHEKWGRTLNGFDTTTPNPLAAAATANYAKAPIAQLPASAFNVLGGPTFATPGDNAVFKNVSHIVSPRVGFAWSPGKNTSLRGGFGVFTQGTAISYLSLAGTYSTNPSINQQGFSQTTTMVAPTATSLVTANTASLSNPFPNGFLQPAGRSAGLTTAVNQTLSFMNPEMKSPYSMRWNMGYQRTFLSNVLLEVLYIGSHALHVPVSTTQINGIPRQYLSTSFFRDPSVAYLGSTTVANPFAGLVPGASSTATSAQLLAHFPEFPVGDGATGWNGGGGVFEQNASVGSSYFHSLNIGISKRMSNNLMVRFNYTRSRLIEYNSWLNDSDARPERRISPTDRPNRFVTYFTYTLPIGKGQWMHFNSKVGNTLIGGWSLAGVYQHQTGAPITWVNGSSSSPGDYVYFGAPLDLNNRAVDGFAFNRSAFDTVAADAFNYHLRTFPTTFNNLRADGINQLDASLAKRFSLGEQRRFELRFEANNLPNHPIFAAPNTTANSSGFGQITATANRFRTIQLVGRLYF